MKKSQNNSISLSEKNLEHIKGEERQKINDAGFYAIGNTDKGYVLTFGNQVVSERKFDTVEEAQDYVNGRPWELILMATLIYGEMVKRVMEENQKTE